MIQIWCSVLEEITAYAFDFHDSALDAQQQREPRLTLGQPSIGLSKLCLSQEGTIVLHLALFNPLHLENLSIFIPLQRIRAEGKFWRWTGRLAPCPPFLSWMGMEILQPQLHMIHMDGHQTPHHVLRMWSALCAGIFPNTSESQMCYIWSMIHCTGKIHRSQRSIVSHNH